MLIGVEEEFILVDSSNFFHTPSAARVLLSMLIKDKAYIYQSSLETPFGRGKRPTALGDYINGFSIVEIKTSPHKDLESLKEEIIYHRNNLIDAVNDANLALLPIGLHPLFSPGKCSSENCAALHIHIDSSKKRYFNVLSKIPQLIALTANSPFTDGKPLAWSSRAIFSPSIGVPNNFYERKSDLIINKVLNTIEIRACDTQLFSEDVIGAAATIECIARLKDYERISKSAYIEQRNKAIYFGKEKINTAIFEEILNPIAEELSLDDYVSNFLARKTGYEIQMECFFKYDLPTLLTSLWSSMKKGRFSIAKSEMSPDTIIYGSHNLTYLLPYFPVLILNILKKIKQDDVLNTTTLFKSRSFENDEYFYKSEV